MAQKTSINIKPCNLGSSSPHNKRSAEYLANIRKEKFYIRTDLMARNEMWVSSQLGDTSLTDYYNQIAAMVKEKTDRAMQTKDRERVNKKTGKVTIVRGSTPLKEGVVVIKDDTTMEQLRDHAREQAAAAARYELAMTEISHREGIDITEADVDAKYAELSKQYGLSVELLRQQLPPLRLRHDLKLAAAQAVVVDSAKRK